MTTSNITPAGQQAQSQKALAKELNTDYSTDNGSIADIDVQLQLFSKSGGNLTKSISVDDKGNLVKDSSECRMPSGTVKTITTTPRLFAKALSNTEPNQAWALSNVDYPDGRTITTKGNENGNIISRSSEHFPFVSGPAFLLFDVDTGDGYNPETIDQVLPDVTKFIPEFEYAAKIIRPSTGSNIKLNSTGKVLSSNTGWHIYCVVKDASSLSDLKAIRERLLARAWNAGLGHIKISKSGSELFRCPIDLAVFSPERLIFEAEPTLSDDLVKDKVETVYIDGGYIL